VFKAVWLAWTDEADADAADGFFYGVAGQAIGGAQRCFVAGECFVRLSATGGPRMAWLCPTADAAFAIGE